MVYCTRSDVEAQYGRSNVAKWADLDNEDVAEDADARVAWAIAAASEEIDDRLRFGPYAVPFEDPPGKIVRMAAAYAGVLLYEQRGVTDKGDEPDDQLGAQRKQFMRDVRDILARHLRLDAETQAVSYPQAVSMDDEE